MKCKNCGAGNPDNAVYCQACGAPLPKSKSISKTAIICITAVLVALIIAGTCIAAVVIKNNKEKTDNPTSNGYVQTEEDEEDSSAEEDTTEKATTAATTRAMPTNPWDSTPSNQLYRPGKESFVNPYDATVFCIDTDVQDFVKMRKGPSKRSFDTVGSNIPNYEKVQVETKSINGWTLCYYEKNSTEGWIRSDFLFKNTKDIPTTATTKPIFDLPEPSETEQEEVEEETPLVSSTRMACPGYYWVFMDDESGEGEVSMREAPSEDSALIIAIPSGGDVSIDEETPIIDGWVWVTYGDFSEEDDPVYYRGYVPYDYLTEMEEGAGDKPVLYLYPETTQTVQVKVHLAPSVRFGTTYPAYQNGWTVTAAPDGTLTNHADHRTYSYLFWDLKGTANYDFSKGFVVEGKDTAAFLQTTLDKIGLTPREANEFIVYWLPKMEKNPYNLISFQTKAYTDLVGLEITPQPDSMLRVFMAYKKLDAPVSVSAQTFKPFVRQGFSAVEWGGVEVQ